jgi:uncharacterized protein DUF6350
VVIGLATGWLLTRRLTRSRRASEAAKRDNSDSPASGQPAWSLVLTSALLAGPVAGVVLGALAWLAGGPLGAGRLAQIGPVPWQVALTGTVVVAVSVAIGAALARAFRRS